jgi:hypothetical protein
MLHQEDSPFIIIDHCSYSNHYFVHSVSREWAGCPDL